jgi:hypothetical protein
MVVCRWCSEHRLETGSPSRTVGGVSWWCLHTKAVATRHGCIIASQVLRAKHTFPTFLLGGYLIPLADSRKVAGALLAIGRGVSSRTVMGLGVSSVADV